MSTVNGTLCSLHNQCGANGPDSALIYSFFSY